MILYNVTVNVEQSIEDDWIQWMKEIHIPEVLATGHFVENKMYRLLMEQPDGTITYSVQYFARDLNSIDAYLTNDAPVLQQKVMQRYGKKALAFRTVLEEI